MRGDRNQVWLFGRPYLWEVDEQNRLFLRADRIQRMLHPLESRRRHREFISEEKLSTQVGRGASQWANQAALYARVAALSPSCSRCGGPAPPYESVEIDPLCTSCVIILSYTELRRRIGLKQ